MSNGLSKYRLEDLTHSELVTEVERLKRWQSAYARGRAGLVEQADADYARAEKNEAEVERLREALKRIASGNFIRKDAYVIAREALGETEAE